MNSLFTQKQGDEFSNIQFLSKFNSMLLCWHCLQPVQKNHHIVSIINSFEKCLSVHQKFQVLLLLEVFDGLPMHLVTPFCILYCMTSLKRSPRKYTMMGHQDIQSEVQQITDVSCIFVVHSQINGFTFHLMLW